MLLLLVEVGEVFEVAEEVVEGEEVVGVVEVVEDEHRFQHQQTGDPIRNRMNILTWMTEAFRMAISA